MTRRSFLVILGLAVALIAGPAPAGPSREAHLQVGVFDGSGASPDCVLETFEALRIDPVMRPRRVSAIQIAQGALKQLDVLIFPGGSGSAEYNNLGSGLRERIRAFVIQEGRGVVGICAGAYLISDTENYPCLNLISAAAIDRDHDERGSAVARVSFSKDGLSHFPEMKDMENGFLQYHDGPIFVPSRGASVPAYRELATLQSDIHQGGGAPASLTPGKPFLLCQQQGRGRVFACVGHPESTIGMRWMVARMARWAAGRNSIPYPSRNLRPGYTQKEILHDDSLETQAFWKLCGDDPGPIVEALHFLAAGRYRNGFRWAKGLLRHTAPEVRREAARHIVESEYTAALPDLEAAFHDEEDAATRRELAQCLKQLESLLAPANG